MERHQNPGYFSLCTDYDRHIFRNISGKIFVFIVFPAGIFVKWTAIAFVIANVVAWFSLNARLNNFAYHTNIPAGVSMLAGFITMLLALITAGRQSYRTAILNPAETLRHE